MSPRPGQDPNSPQFQDSLNRWKQENNLSAAPDGNSYGAFMNLPSGSRVDRRFVDKDGDGTDDRYQSGPGKPRGGGTGGVKPMPVKPSPVRPAPPLTAMRRGVVENKVGASPFRNNAVFAETYRQDLYQQRADAMFGERQKMTQAQQPSPVQQVTPMPDTAGTSSKPDYQRGRRKRGLSALRAM